MSRSEYYRIAKTQDSEEKELENKVIHCFEKHRGNYGAVIYFRVPRNIIQKACILQAFSFL